MLKEAESWIREQHGEHGVKVASFPRSMDINPTARCNLVCEFCWGPDRSIPDGLDTNQWKGAIELFAQNGTDSIVFTGGEPLIRKDIGELVRFAKDRGMRVTLSTNTLLLKQKASQVLPFIDEIGIPLDGSTTENNSLMRAGNSNAFQSSLDAIALLSEDYPEIEVTIRTVLSKINKDDIGNMGKLLGELKGRFDRWKLYQFAPVNTGLGNRDKFEVSQAEFERITRKTVDQFPGLPIVVYPSEQRTGRYVFLGPEGNIFGVGEDGDYFTVGNYLKMSTEETIIRVAEMTDVSRNKLHGKFVLTTTYPEPCFSL